MLKSSEVIKFKQVSIPENSGENRQENYEQNYEPGEISPSTALLKIFGAIGTGVLANLVLIVLFLLSQSALEPLTQAGNLNMDSPFLIFVIIAMSFSASLVANTFGVWLLGLIESDKFQRRSTYTAHVFAFNIFFLLVLLPFYLLAANFGEGGFLITVSAMHFFLSAFCSLLIMQIIGNPNYAMLGFYSLSFAFTIALALNTALFQITNGNFTISLFAALPLLWALVGVTDTVFTILYRLFYLLSGKNFLLSETQFGDDYGIPTAESELMENQEKTIQNDSGADFLRKKNTPL
jgi:hypothetical protein